MNPTITMARVHRFSVVFPGSGGPMVEVNEYTASRPNTAIFGLA